MLCRRQSVCIVYSDVKGAVPADLMFHWLMLRLERSSVCLSGRFIRLGYNAWLVYASYPVLSAPQLRVRDDAPHNIRYLMTFTDLERRHHLLGRARLFPEDRSTRRAIPSVHPETRQRYPVQTLCTSSHLRPPLQAPLVRRSRYLSPYHPMTERTRLVLRTVIAITETLGAHKCGSRAVPRPHARTSSIV